MLLNFGFISTRFAGTDGVSLEARKWGEVLERRGHRCFWLAGELDHPVERSMLVEEAHFNHPGNLAINKECFGSSRTAKLTEKIENSSNFLKDRIKEFVNRFKIDVLIAQNSLTIPMPISLGVGLARYIKETSISTIAHHHDFAWERSRFDINSVQDYLDSSFPPVHPSLHAATINSEGAYQLGLRRGVESDVIPNIMDFEAPPKEMDEYGASFRRELGFDEDEIIFLQPTRVVPRKGIELSVELLGMLSDKRHKLVITHAAGDEGKEYLGEILVLAKSRGVDCRLIDGRVGHIRVDGKNPIFPLADAYRNADFVCYPSIYEGFGNALLETFYYKKPVLVNRYPVYKKDIEPLGFKAVHIDGKITQKACDETLEYLNSRQKREEAVEHNYKVALENYSYKNLDEALAKILARVVG